MLIADTLVLFSRGCERVALRMLVEGDAVDTVTGVTFTLVIVAARVPPPLLLITMDLVWPASPTVATTVPKLRMRV